MTTTVLAAYVRVILGPVELLVWLVALLTVGFLLGRTTR